MIRSRSSHINLPRDSDDSGSNEDQSAQLSGLLAGHHSPTSTTPQLQITHGAVSDSVSDCSRKCSSSRSVCSTRRWKLLVWLVVFSVVAYTWLFTSDMEGGVWGGRPQSISNQHNGQLTIVMNTFRRNDMMEDAIDHYKFCKLVGAIHIVWSDQKYEPPHKLVGRYQKSEKPKIIFDRYRVDSLNNRFHPLNGTHTDAIFSVDDDMRISCADLNLAYEAWLNSPKSLVGFMPRTFLRRKDDVLVYRCWWTVWWSGKYSIVLTKAAILHHDFLFKYTKTMPEEIRTFVDKKKNCEDIAMQFLIAHETKTPPIYVRGNLIDKGALNGISSKNPGQSAHMKDRSACLSELVRLYKGVNPLVSSHIVVNTAKSFLYNQPSTWIEYISSDLWSTQ